MNITSESPWGWFLGQGRGAAVQSWLVRAALASWLTATRVGCVGESHARTHGGTMVAVPGGGTAPDPETAPARPRTVERTVCVDFQNQRIKYCTVLCIGNLRPFAYIGLARPRDEAHGGSEVETCGSTTDH